MSVRAKFFVTRLVNPEGATAAEVGLTPVCRGVENALWSQATPSGSITMHVKNNPAFEQFEQGAEYEVTFRKVEKPMPGDGHQVKPVTNMHGWDVCEICGAHLGASHALVERETWRAGYGPDSEAYKKALVMHEETYAKAE